MAMLNNQRVMLWISQESPGVHEKIDVPHPLFASDRLDVSWQSPGRRGDPGARSRWIPVIRGQMGQRWPFLP